MVASICSYLASRILGLTLAQQSLPFLRGGTNPITTFFRAITSSISLFYKLLSPGLNPGPPNATPDPGIYVNPAHYEFYNPLSSSSHHLSSLLFLLFYFLKVLPVSKPISIKSSSLL